MNYAEASAALRPLWDSWAEACEAQRAAKKAYYDAAAAQKIRLCQHCAKPMPDGDHSSNCDGCHLGWDWDSPRGRRNRRAAELDAELARIKAEREALGENE